MPKLNYNQVWAEPLQLKEKVVIQIGLQISDNLSLPWQDGVSFFKKGSAASGQVHQAQFSEDLLMGPQGDKISLLFQLSLSLADNLSLPWQDGVSFLKDATLVATAGQTSQAQFS